MPSSVERVVAIVKANDTVDNYCGTFPAPMAERLVMSTTRLRQSHSPPRGLDGPRPTPRARPLRREFATLITAAVVLAACGGSSTRPARAGATSTTLATTPDGLAAMLEQYREDQITKTIQIQVVNQSTRTVRLSELRLTWPGLTATAVGSRSDLVGPGQVLDLPVPLGDAVCGDPPKADAPVPASRATASATQTWEGGVASSPVTIPITDTRGVLARVFRPDCQRQSVEHAASVAFDPEWTDITTPDGRPATTGTLRLHRRHGNDPVTVTAINGSVLLTIAPVTRPAPGAPLLTLAGAATDATLPVIVTESGACAAHSLAESKHTFFLPVALTVGANPVVITDVIPDDTAKLQLAKMINRSCGVN